MTTGPAVTITMLTAGSVHLLDRVAAEVFDGPIERARAVEFAADSRHHLALALDADLVVGMASGVHYVHPDKPPELWINEVGVAPTHQGHGIGKRLVARLLAHGRALGCGQAWVLTEHTNGAAQRLYAASGGVRVDDPVLYEFHLDATDNDPER